MNLFFLPHAHKQKVAPKLYQLQGALKDLETEQTLDLDIILLPEGKEKYQIVNL